MHRRAISAGREISSERWPPENEDNLHSAPGYRYFLAEPETSSSEIWAQFPGDLREETLSLGGPVPEDSGGEDQNEEEEEGPRSKTNGIKNFINNLYKWLKSDPYPKQKFLERDHENFNGKKFNKVTERLKKMINKDGYKHKIEHLQTLLIYKKAQDLQLTRYLLQMCEEFLDRYPEIVKSSPKMNCSAQTINDNLLVIDIVYRFLHLTEVGY